MTEKEIAEIRRRFRADKNNISSVRGCYVNDKQEIVAEFCQPLSIMPEEDSDKFLSIIKKTLSGTLNKNLIDIEFTTQQVVESPEHKLLMALKDSSLNDEEAIHNFFQRVIESVTMEDNYVILLAHDVYDVPYRSKDGERQDDASSEVFSYIVCSICPVKLSKPALSYYVYDNEFHSRAADWIVSPPEIGLMFPAFDDRSTNIYNAVYYTKDTTRIYQDFVDAIFKSDIPMPAAEQKETFQEILSDTLGLECDYEVVHAVHSHMQNIIEENKADKEIPLEIKKDTVKQILRTNGVSENHIEDFEQRYDSEFGQDTSLHPRNIVDAKRVDITTPYVKIQLNTEFSDFVETRVIDGAKYILIRAEEGVELNGVPIHIK